MRAAAGANAAARLVSPATHAAVLESADAAMGTGAAIGTMVHSEGSDGGEAPSLTTASTPPPRRTPPSKAAIRNAVRAAARISNDGAVSEAAPAYELLPEAVVALELPPELQWPTAGAVPAGVAW